MRLPKATHTARMWHIHELTDDFDLEDVWALPTPGGPDDFPQLVDFLRSYDPSKNSSMVVRTLFDIRRRLGQLFRWDGPQETNSDVTVRDQFRPLYEHDDEVAFQTSNKTVDGILHLGWVQEETGGYRGELAIYVKRNGLLGTVYMAGIRPFRYVIVYPALMREIERMWADGRRESARS